MYGSFIFRTMRITALHINKPALAVFYIINDPFVKGIPCRQTTTHLFQYQLKGLFGFLRGYRYNGKWCGSFCQRLIIHIFIAHAYTQPVVAAYLKGAVYIISIYKPFSIRDLRWFAPGIYYLVQDALFSLGTT